MIESPITYSILAAFPEALGFLYVDVYVLGVAMIGDIDKTMSFEERWADI